MHLHPYPFLFRQASSRFLIAGGLLLLIDACAWAGTFLLGRLATTGPIAALLSVVLAPLMIVVFFLGLPLIFIGVLALRIGVAIRWLRVHSTLLPLLISGALSIAVGLLALVVSQLLALAGSGDTTLAWMAGLTSLLVGIPLPLLGGGLVLIAVVKAVVRTAVPKNP